MSATTNPPGPSPSTAQAPIVCNNFIQGIYQPSSSSNPYLPVISPVDGTQVGKVCISNAADVDMAVACAQEAFPGWSGLTMKARASIMFRFQHLMETHAEELAQLVVRENGKNIAEARASVAKGNETVEWACGLPQMAQGKILQVSRGVTCSDMREPIGVVASVSPLNFPIMCPMWTIPIALTAGNCVILKPSEKVPLTMHRVAALLHEAGVPPGVFQTVNGTAEAVNGLIDHPGVAGTFCFGCVMLPFSKFMSLLSLAQSLPCLSCLNSGSSRTPLPPSLFLPRRDVCRVLSSGRACRQSGKQVE